MVSDRNLTVELHHMPDTRHNAGVLITYLPRQKTATKLVNSLGRTR
jgi:hypothetical protein